VFWEPQLQETLGIIALRYRASIERTRVYCMAASERSGSEICDDCRRLTLDVLLGSTHSNNHWTTITSEYATISFTRHRNGTFESLQQSAIAGCELCNLMCEKLTKSSECIPKDTYSVFVWQRVPSKTQFQVVYGSVERFTRHISEWENPLSLMLFGQISSGLPVQELGKSQVSSAAERPLLSLLPNPHHGSREAIRQAEKWLQECKTNHSECSRLDVPLPRRVLRLDGSGKDLKISLYLTKREILPYTALSYSWGESDRIESKGKPTHIPSSAVSMDGIYVIERRNRHADPDQRYVRFWDPADISLDAFPTTQRDAIMIAKALGFQYIWLDSLCIIQDSDPDWADQVAELTDIYSGAAVVISATSSKTSMDGILNEVPNKRLRIGTWPSDVGQPLDVYVGEPSGVLDLEDKFISTRAWVFQERLVSTATLHYTDEGLVWECVNGIQMSHDQNPHCLPWKAEWRGLLKQMNVGLSNISMTSKQGKTPNDVWYDWVNAYSERNLYDATDKFPAIAGVTRKFAQAFHFTFVAGLWKEDFLSGLLWHRHNRTETLIRYRNKYVAPSWSWASVQGRLEHRSVQLHDSIKEEKGPTLKVLEYNVEEERALADGQRSYEQLQPGATITVEGLLQPITVDRHHHPGVRKRIFQNCGVSQGFLNNDNIICTLDEYDTSIPFKDLPRFYECWCLRVASYRSGKREADMFLLLDREEGKEEFHRVGFAEADPYWCVEKLPLNSGIFECAHQPVTLVIG